MNTQNIMASTYHSNVRLTQNRGVPLFSCLGHGALYTYMFWYRQSFSETSNLINLVEIQR